MADSSSPQNDFKQALPWYILALVMIVLDQVTKLWADSSLTFYQPVEITPFFNLTLMYNEGAAWSFLSDAGGWQRWLFAVLSSAVSVMLVIWLARVQKHEKLLAVALGLVLGGAVGNLIDRMAYGHVIDFISLHYNNRYFPAFNIADSAISVGAALLIWESFFGKKPEDGS
jgi:signal peptidase II